MRLLAEEVKIESSGRGYYYLLPNSTGELILDKAGMKEYESGICPLDI